MGEKKILHEKGQQAKSYIAKRIEKWREITQW